jgi:hypothetical protein
MAPFRSFATLRPFSQVFSELQIPAIIWSPKGAIAKTLLHEMTKVRNLSEMPWEVHALMQDS